MRHRQQRWQLLCVVGALALVMTACPDPDDDPAVAPTPAPDPEFENARAELQDAEGESVGSVVLSTDAGQVRLRAEVTGMTPGFHGFHVHTTGECEAPDFTSAGGHYNPAGDDHQDHAGDLPVLLVNEDGTGILDVTTDRFSVDELLDDDGTAIIVHENPDNYANIPERYDDDGPDEDTLATGDAGPRAACGVIEGLETAPEPPAAPAAEARAALQDAEGQEVGSVMFATRDDKVDVRAVAQHLDAGFHGFHIHETGACEPPDFTSAGGHYNPDGEDHRDHAGDMPPLLVNSDGTASLGFETDRFTVDELVNGLLDEMLNGAAVIVHAAPDNFANIPERYGDADDETRAAGDAGGRVACGVIEQVE